MQLIHLCCLALLVCAVVADDKHPVYTIVSSGEQFCMQNDLPEDTEIEAIFNMTSITGGSLPSDMFIDVFVRNPDQSIYAQKKFKPAGDSIRVTGKESGVYEACATIPKTSMWSKEQYRLYFHLDFGSEVGENEIAVKDELNAVEKSFKQAERRLVDIQKQHKYHKDTEEKFHQVSISTNRKILVWSAIQVIAFFACAYFQMAYLKKFFKTKKLI